MPEIHWYPGHIAKAERQLKEQLKRVDLVLEVLDARVPLASHHPQVPQWIGKKPRLVILNRCDMIPKAIAQQWRQWFHAQGQTIYLTNAKQGQGTKAIIKASQGAGRTVNEKRRSRGLQPRPVRAVVIGFPNVGKSALINRLVGRKAVASARRAGVTRQLQWVKVSSQIELLDAPGVIPGRLDNQGDAVKLAICEDIGEAAYDNQRLAAAAVDLLVELAYERVLGDRYGIDPLKMTGESFVYELGQGRHQGDTERAARAILDDFRTGLLGLIPLERPDLETDA